MARNTNIVQSIDKLTVLLVFLLSIFGWCNIYGASYTPESTNMFDFANYAGKQFVWMLTAIGIATIILIIDHKAYEYFAYIIYAIAIIVLIITPIVTHSVTNGVKGSYSFIPIGPLKLQPAEFSKFAIALALAKYMGRQEYKIENWRDLIVPALIILVPMFIIMVPQKETGTALVLASLIFVLYREGMSGYVLLAIFALALLSVIVIKYNNAPLPLGTGDFGFLICMILLLSIEFFHLLIKQRKTKEALIMLGGVVAIYGISLIINIWETVNFNIISAVVVVVAAIYLAIITYKYRLKHSYLLVFFNIIMIVYCSLCNYAFEKILLPHQKNRIEQILGIIDDPSGIGYNSLQAKIAIATGRITGKGFHEGTQTQMKYVPEQHTDFIFCTVGEEWGFVGTVGVLILYTVLLIHLIKMSERQRNKFSRIYGYCVVSILFFHVAINIGMVIGLLPIIGIPLPFFSYGGSSLWGFTILISIFLKLDTERVNEL